MRPLHYSINVMLDGCVDHMAGIPNEQTHRHSAEIVGSADALIFGRVTYGLMEMGWLADNPDRPAWQEPFAESINAAKKYLVSGTETPDGWNAELVVGDPVEAVRALKAQPGGTLFTGGVTLPLALASAGLIDQYEFVVHPRLAGHGPYLFDGLPQPLDLTLVGTEDLGDGIVARRYVPAALR